MILQGCIARIWIQITPPFQNVGGHLRPWVLYNNNRYINISIQPLFKLFYFCINVKPGRS